MVWMDMIKNGFVLTGLLVAAFCFGQQTIPVVDSSLMEIQVRKLIDESISKLENAKKSANAWGQLGQVLHAHEVFDAAVHCYDQARQLDPDNFRWPYLAGHARLRYDKEVAISYFEIALSLEQNNETIFFTYGDALSQTDRSDAAQEAYQRALQINKDSVPALLGLARDALILGDTDASRILLEQAVVLAPAAGDIYTLLAQVYMQQDESELAEHAELMARVWRKPFQRQDPLLTELENLAVNSLSYATRGRQLAKQGALPEAEMQLRLVLTLRSGTPTDYGNLATVLSRQGKYREAIEYYNRGLAQNADNVTLLSHQGLTLMQAGKLTLAEASLARATSLDPSYPEAQFNSGVLRYRQGRHPDAIAYFERALTLNPGLTDAYLNLGSTLAAIGDLEGAVTQWLKLKLIQPENPALLYNIGLVRARLGQHAEAISEFEEGLMLAPMDPRFAAALARELATVPVDNMRDGTRAVELASQLLRKRPNDPVVLELLAAALAETGQFKEAIRQAEKALELASGNRSLVNQIRVGLALYHQGLPFHQTPVALHVEQ